MAPPVAAHARDRPTIPLPSLASLGRPASKTPPSLTAIAPLYRPVAGGPTVYRPASSNAGAAPPPSAVRAAPPRRWPFVGGVVLILSMIGTVSVGMFSPAPTATIGTPGTRAPVTTDRNPGPVPAIVPTPAVPAPALALRTHAPPRAVPAPKALRVTLPAPRVATPTPVLAPTATPLPPATPVPTVTPLPTVTPVPTVTPGVTPSGPGDGNGGGQKDQQKPTPEPTRPPRALLGSVTVV